MTEGLQKGEMMGLGAVQSGYAKPAYAYQKRNRLKEDFNNEISSAAQMMGGETENDSKVIGLAMIPCGDTNVNYSVKAQYAAESTPDEPVIQVTSNYGGEWVSYKVNVNEVNPWNASQLEMFALLSYSDDQGISDGGASGSYHRMRVYADNAQMNGSWEGNEGWDGFVNAKHDWLAIMNQITDDYSRAGVYSQYLNGQKLVETLSHFSILHVDFDNLKIEDKTADAFSHYELNIPRNVLKAWIETVGEVGTDRIDDDMFTHMSSAMIRRFSQIQDENPAGDPIEAALRAAREALLDLGYPLAPELEFISGIRTELENEKTFYQTFIIKLEKLQEEARTEEKVNNAETAEKSDGSPEEADDIDLMQFIRKRIEEIFVLIQNGDTEASFQIGNSSFTIKEWEKFLERFDDIEDAIRELMRERIEKRTEETIEEAAGGKAAPSKAAKGIDALVSEATRCTYPASVPGQDDAMYITWYTKEGIFCRKAGQHEGYEWSVYFEHEEDYRKVIEFLDGFDREDNLRFAAHENFWQDFLKDEIDLDGFLDFYGETEHGIPDYTVTRGDSTYIDREKIQWAKYMNLPETRLYTGEEMMKMQEELIEANRAKLIKLTAPYSKVYQKAHPEYHGESIFCEYPGGPLYTADEIAERMMRNLSDRQYLAMWNERYLGHGKA